MRCDAVLSHTGKFLHNFCFKDAGDLAHVSYAISNAAKHATIKPARINGVGRKVWFQYFIALSQKGEKTTIEAFANSGLELKKYGPDYSSAQRFDIGKGYFAIGCGAGFSKSIIVNAVVGNDGKTKSVDVPGEDNSEKCVENLKEDFRQQEFIPAIVNGTAVDSYYSEEIFNRSGISSY
jgi:hypothetical protein